MVARVEEPRVRSALLDPRADTSRYPGLTPDERAIPLDSPAPRVVDEGPPPPLWIAPIEIPPASRSVGFVAAYPEALPDALPPDPPASPERDGLFDVPGLLERLWLARALESGRERSAAVPAAHPPAPPLRRSDPLTDPGPNPSPAATVAPPRAPVPVTSSARPNAPSPTPVRSWICPTCYLTNDIDSAACSGCRQPAPGL